MKYTTEERDIYVSALEHWVEDHHDTDTFRSVVDDVRVAVECDGCGDEFVTDLKAGAGRLGADLHCPDCVEADKFKAVFVTELSAREVIDYQETGEA